MNHRVYTGSFAALEARWLEEVGRLQAEDPLHPVPVLVGSNVLASYLKVLLAGRGRPAANVRFKTFLDLATSLSRFEPPSRPRLPRLGTVTVLDELLEADVPEEFRKVASYPGFRANLLDTFRDLRDAGITVQDLDRSLPELKRGMKDRGAHLEALAALYRRFRREIERFHDVDDEFRSAIRAASRAPADLGSAHLLVYGLYDVTGQQQDLLTALGGVLGLTYFVPFVHSSETRFAESFLNARCRELGVRAEPVDEPADRSGLGRLGAAGFGLRPGEPAGAISGDGSIRFVSAPGQSRAAVEIVREILTAVKDGAAAGFHEIAVLFRHPADEAPIVAEALRLRGIPHFLHGGLPFEEKPLCRAVLAVAALEPDGFSRAAVLAAMGFLSAALPAPLSEKWDAQLYRALTRESKFLTGIEGWNDGTLARVLRARLDCERAESGEAIDDERRTPPSPAGARLLLGQAEALRDAWTSLKDAASGWPAVQTWSGWAGLLEQRLGALLDSAEDWPAFCSVIDEIRSLGALHERRRISRSRMMSLLRESISGHSRSEGRFMRSGVNLLPLGAARGIRLPVVIVPGMEEGSFPARPRQDPLLLDRERALVGGMFSKLPQKLKRREEETLLFSMAARAAEKRLVLVTSRLDERTDRERIPSEFFLRVAECAAGSAMTLRDLADGRLQGFRSVSLENPAPKPGQLAVDPGEIRLRLITGDRSARHQALRALAAAEPELLRRSMVFDQARWKRELTEFDGRISDPELIRWISGKVGPAAAQVSATRLEDFARCPYLFFLKRVAGLEQWEEPEPAQCLDARSRGSAVHSILETFVGELDGGRLFTDSEESLAQALLACSRKILNSSRPPGIPELLWELEQEALDQTLGNWLAFERERGASGLFPRFVEHPFGTLQREQPLPPFTVQAGPYKFEFRGKIDRVDVSRDGRHARVIDYKTGAVPRSMKGKRPILMAGEKMQIAVYRGALQASCPEIHDIRGEYLHLQLQRKGEIAPVTFGNGTLGDGLERLKLVLELIGKFLESGVFFARTEGSLYDHNCTYCAYTGVCGKDAARRAEMKSQDAAVLEFSRLVEIDGPVDCE